MTMIQISYLTIPKTADELLAAEEARTGVKRIDLIRLAIAEHIRRYQAAMPYPTLSETPADTDTSSHDLAQGAALADTNRTVSEVQ